MVIRGEIAFLRVRRTGLLPAPSRNRRADLHVHTTASDGTLTPAEVVEVATARGLAAVGIADHDTVSGIGPALNRARELGRRAPEVVPAVEISTDFGDGEIHILGYFIDWGAEMLVETLENLRARRLARAAQIVERLSGLGLPVSLERIISLREEGSVGRPHVARALVEAGHVGSLREAFDRFLSRGRPAFVERERFTPVEAIQTVNRAGGVAVLAHPGSSVALNLIEELLEAGLEGLEVYHPVHGPRERQRYAGLAAERGLVATGGSDSHDPGATLGADIGDSTVDYGVVNDLRRRMEGRRG